MRYLRRRISQGATYEDVVKDSVVERLKRELKEARRPKMVVIISSPHSYCVELKEARRNHAAIA